GENVPGEGLASQDRQHLLGDEAIMDCLPSVAAIADRRKRTDEVEPEIGRCDIALVALVGGLDGAGGGPDGGPAGTGCAQGDGVVGGRAKAEAEADGAGAGSNGHRIGPGRTVAADLDAEG